MSRYIPEVGDSFNVRFSYLSGEVLIRIKNEDGVAVSKLKPNDNSIFAISLTGPSKDVIYIQPEGFVFEKVTLTLTEE